MTRHADEQLLRHVGGEDAERARVAERDVREVDRAQVLALLREPGTQEREVIVLDQDGCALGRLVDERLREPVVVRPVRVPRYAPTPVDARPAGEVEQAVVQEPERAVGDHVVRHAVRVGLDGERSEAEALGLDRPRLGHLPIGVGHGCREPERARVTHERPEAGHEPTRTSLCLQPAVGAVGERDRPAVGGHHNRLHPGHHTGMPGVLSPPGR